MPGKNENRVRPLTIAFRITPELNDRINLLVAASNMTKQDYITSKLLDEEVIFVPSVNTVTALRNEMREVCKQLNRIRNGCEPSEHLLALCDRLADIFLGLRNDTTEAEADLEDLRIRSMERG